MELIDKHKFTRAAIDENSETFVVHIAALEALKLNIHPSQAPLLAALQEDKAPIEILPKYTNYIKCFFSRLGNRTIQKHHHKQVCY